MDTLSASELLLGFSNPAFVSQRVVLSQLLCNKCFDAESCADVTIERLLIHCFTECTRSRKDKNDDLVKNYSLLTISNLTTSEDVCDTFCYLVSDSNSPISSKWKSILEVFFNYDTASEQFFPLDTVSDIDAFWMTSDPLQHVASILCNLTSYETMRTELMRRSTNYVPRLLTLVSNFSLLLTYKLIGTCFLLIQISCAGQKQEFNSAKRYYWRFKKVCT